MWQKRIRFGYRKKQKMLCGASNGSFLSRVRDEIRLERKERLAATFLPVINTRQVKIHGEEYY